MKTGKSLVELATELDRQRERKVDFVAPTSQISVEPASVPANDAEAKPARAMILRAGDQAYPMRDLALAQASERVGIPIKYMRKMQAEQPGLLATNLNTWFQAKSERRLIRTLDGTARAFLSDRYQRIDNFDVANVALESLLKYSGLNVRSTEVTENRLYIKATFPGLQREIKSARAEGVSPVHKARVGDIVEAGVMITNSEVGLGAVSVSKYALYLWCDNGAVAEKPKRWFHVGSKIEGDEIAYLSDETVKAGDKFDLLRIRDAISAAFDEKSFDGYIAKVQGATQDHIQAINVAKGIEVLGNRLVLSKEETSSVMAHLIQGGDLSRYGVFNAVTRTAEDSGNYDRATELEALGQAVIDLAPSEWRQIAEAA